LFEAHTTWIGFRRGSVLRAYMYEFLELLAPHLPKKFVKKTEQFKTQEELDRQLSSLSVPQRGI
jgi:LysR family cys regulon transcriptional activator